MPKSSDIQREQDASLGPTPADRQKPNLAGSTAYALKQAAKSGPFSKPQKVK